MKTVSAIDMDAIDRQILRLLQQDGRMTNAALAQSVGLSESACLRRLKTLESSNVIDRYAAVVNERAAGLPLCVFVTITLSSLSEATVTAFEAGVVALPEVMECHVMTGDADYLLRLAVRDIDDLERLHSKTLTRLPGVTRISSSLAMRTVVKRSALPI